ncbi:hypothetical protein, partial [Citrobacter freundii]|uniref:hypothetical protein n=1 Tax=Citrobacter freundii TaxID=546 RepID=UPI001959A812
INQKDDIFFLKTRNVNLCYIFSFSIWQGTFPNSSHWALSEIFHFRQIPRKYSVDMLVDGMRPLFLVPGFLFTSDDANRKVVLAG